jgi:O-antigen/teichoic acid export membrane protein
MAKTSAKGGFKLFLGVSVSSVITAVCVILLINLLGEGTFGLIATALIYPTLFGLVKDWGIQSAMIKYLAQYKAENNFHGLKSVMVSVLLFELVMGVLLTFISFFSADFLAARLATETFSRAEFRLLIEVASFTILADSFLKISQSTFIGLERLEFHSLTMIVNSTLRILIAPALVLFGYSVLGAIQGQIVAQLVAGTIGLAIFFVIFFRTPRKLGLGDLHLKATLKTLLRYGLPLSIL